jgi:hypothetical protein
MLTASQARELQVALQKQHVEVELYNILKDVAERAIDTKARNYVYVDVDYVDEKVDYLVKRLISLGYKVEMSKYPEDGYTSLTVRF